MDQSSCWMMLLGRPPCENRVAKDVGRRPEGRHGMASTAQGIFLDFLYPSTAFSASTRLCHRRGVNKTRRPTDFIGARVRLSHSSPAIMPEAEAESEVDSDSSQPPLEEPQEKIQANIGSKIDINSSGLPANETAEVVQTKGAQQTNIKPRGVSTKQAQRMTHSERKSKGNMHPPFEGFLRNPAIRDELKECFLEPPISIDHAGQEEVSRSQGSATSPWDIHISEEGHPEEDTARYLSAYKELIRPWYRMRLPGRNSGRMGYALSLLHRPGRVEQAIRIILTHLRRFYGEESPRVYSIAMAFVGAHGFVGAVEKLLDRRWARHGPPERAQTFAPLLHAYALRRRLKDAIHYFGAISAEHSLTPDASCWNALILAHSEADDLDGARRCFEEFEKTGLKMDSSTLAPLLDICARRGDVEGIQMLLERADASTLR